MPMTLARLGGTRGGAVTRCMLCLGVTLPRGRLLRRLGLRLAVLAAAVTV
ncbi:MAG: hypothetical protein HYV75_06690, partial [Opitutae bacterium]|nr:hypothetical protein [Opitutae bacterium]